MTITTPMLGDVVRHWLDATILRVDISVSTVREYRRIADHLITFGAKRALGVVDMAEYVHVRRDDRVAPRTIGLELRVAGVAFSWAKKNGKVTADADLRVPRLKIDANRFVINHHTPMPSDVAKMLAAMPDDDWKIAASLIARTGARIGEVVQLRGVDLDEPGSRIAFGSTDGSCKTGLRWFPLDEHSVKMLRGRSDVKNDPLLDFEGVTAPIQALERRFIGACKAANVSRFTPHGLRRMVVNRLMRARVDPGTAAALTGHSVQVMLRHYRQVTEEDRRTAAEQARLGVLDDPEKPSEG